MSGECDRCGWHCLECICAHPPSQAISDELVETVTKAIIRTAQVWLNEIHAEELARAALEASGIQRLLEREERMREAAARVLSWWPENSENGKAGRSYGSGFADDIRNLRTTLSGEGAGEGLR